MNAEVDKALSNRFAATFRSTDSQDWSDVLGRRPDSRRTRRRAFLAAIVVAAVAAVPALASVVRQLDFWDAPLAPAPVVLEFREMNEGAPEGMSPEAIADGTRMIRTFAFGGSNHTLWVAPTRAGSFCFEWVDAWGGCKAPASNGLTWNGDLVIPNDLQSRLPRDLSPAEAIKLHNAAVPRWIAGYVSASSARVIAIKFVDGMVANPTLYSVSAPISASFFAYDVPANQQTSQDHVVTVEALDADGNVVAAQPLR